MFKDNDAQSLTLFRSILLGDGKHPDLEVVSSLNSDATLLNILMREIGDVPLKLCSFALALSNDVYESFQLLSAY